MKEIILKTEYTNPHGEKMTLIMRKDDSLWFKHQDCNGDFENFKDLVKGKNSKNFKYVLTKDEQVVILNFITLSTNIIEKR